MAATALLAKPLLCLLPTPCLLYTSSKEQPQFEENEAIPVYDTSGPYGDPQIAINVQQDVYKRQCSRRTRYVAAKCRAFDQRTTDSVAENP